MNGERLKGQVGAVLDELAEDGQLTPQALVAAAKPKSSPLHALFDWSDKRAAAKYRLVQARRIIRRHEFTIISDTRILVAPYAVRDPDVSAREQGYVRTVTLRDDREKAKAALHDELGRIAALLTRARALADALGIIGDIERLESELARLQRGLMAA